MEMILFSSFLSRSNGTSHTAREKYSLKKKKKERKKERWSASMPRCRIREFSREGEIKSENHRCWTNYCKRENLRKSSFEKFCEQTRGNDPRLREETRWLSSGILFSKKKDVPCFNKQAAISLRSSSLLSSNGNFINRSLNVSSPRMYSSAQRD